MKLDSLTLTNFRCFSDLHVDLHPQLTVLVAENGQGKTSLLDAIRIALWPYVSCFDIAKNAQADAGNGISINDVRLLKMPNSDMARQLPTKVIMAGRYNTQGPQTWIRYRDSEAKATKTKGEGSIKALEQHAIYLQQLARDPDAPTKDMPVFGYYGTGRLWAQKKLTEPQRGKDDTRGDDFYIRTFAYLNCLDPASSYKHFKEWFIWAFESFREQQIKQLENKGQPQELQIARERVEVVQGVIDIFLQPVTGWHSLEYSVSQDKSLVLHHPGNGTLDVEQLSDGIRNMLAMIGDIAYRCIKLNPHLGVNAAQKSPGVVLIDEVDMHLHPRWQQAILGQLQAAFPNIQFIVTTHSPQVLSTIHRDNIRVIGPDTSGKMIADKPLARTYGEPSGDVMHSVMLVDPQPPVPEKADLQRLTELVDQGQYDHPDAINLIQKLTPILGEQHPQLQRLQRSIQRQRMLG